MPIHNWAKVNAGTFHHFHQGWIQEIARVLNAGHLRQGFYAIAEQVAGGWGPDVLTLEVPENGHEHETADGPSSSTGATAVAERPPVVAFHVIAPIGASR